MFILGLPETPIWLQTNSGSGYEQIPADTPTTTNTRPPHCPPRRPPFSSSSFTTAPRPLLLLLVLYYCFSSFTTASRPTFPPPATTPPPPPRPPTHPFSEYAGFIFKNLNFSQKYLTLLDLLYFLLYDFFAPDIADSLIQFCCQVHQLLKP